MNPAQQAQSDFANFTTSFNALVADNTTKATQITQLQGQISLITGLFDQLFALDNQRAAVIAQLQALLHPPTP